MMVECCMKKEIHIVVTREHTDDLGHLNHVQALAFLEQVRLDFYAKCGLLQEIGEQRFGTIVVNLNMNFRKECFLGDKLTVRACPGTIGTKSFVLSQEIVRPDGEVAIDGLATCVVMDMASRKIIPVPDCLARHFQERS